MLKQYLYNMLDDDYDEFLSHILYSNSKYNYDTKLKLIETKGVDYDMYIDYLYDRIDYINNYLNTLKQGNYSINKELRLQSNKTLLEDTYFMLGELKLRGKIELVHFVDMFDVKGFGHKLCHEDYNLARCLFTHDILFIKSEIK